MTQVFGVVFSSPAVVPLLIDSKRFLVYTFDGSPGPFKDFLGIEEERPKVVLLSSIRKLLQARELDANKVIHAILLFDRADVVSRIEGCTLLDGELDPVNPGTWRVLQDKVTKDTLNETLAGAVDTPFNIPKNVLTQAAMYEPSVFEFLGQLIASVDIPDDFRDKMIHDTAAWMIGMHHPRMWVVRFKKFLLEDYNADPELTLDLYRFCAESKSAYNLWCAYHKCLAGHSVVDAAGMCEAHPGDLQRCVEMFPPEDYPDRESIEAIFKRIPKDEDVVAESPLENM
jgi:hypothetical protein